MYEDLDDVLEVSEDDGTSSEGKEIKVDHAGPDVNVDETLEDKESSHEGTENGKYLMITKYLQLEKLTLNQVLMKMRNMLVRSETWKMMLRLLMRPVKMKLRNTIDISLRNLKLSKYCSKGVSPRIRGNN